MNELENMLKDLYLISGLNMSIFDLNQNLLASYPHKKSKFCNELEKNQKALQHCLDCDYKAMEHIKNTGELYIYKCHFGLNEAIMPLYSYGSLTGYLMMGQAVIGTYQNYSKIIENSKDYFTDNHFLKQLVTKITILNEDQIYAFAQICDICAKYISLTNRIQAKHDNLGQEVKHYIISNYQKQITIEELCHYFFCSRGTLLKHFKSKYHTTIHQFLLNYRLEKAAELLINSHMHIKEIAYQCGFEDPNYFSKAFKKKYNLSPLEFKNQQ
nr:PocR ligand-binding domain-containing protein [uncultured Faecalibacillus sp.]